MKDKSLLRQQLFHTLESQTPAELSYKQSQIQASFVRSSFFHKIGSLGLYAAYKNEVDTRKIFEAAHQRKVSTCFPFIESHTKQLRFYWIDSYDFLHPSSWGPLSPNPQLSILSEAPLEKIEAIVLPGIAFDRQGYRLGRGKGFYDRTLKNYQGLKIGLCYDFQLFDKIVHDPWDICMDIIITEKEFLFLNSFSF